MSETTAIRAEDLYEQIRHEGPSFYPASSWDHFGCHDDYTRRGAFVKRYAWALPSMDAIHDIVRFAAGSAILEIGAGSGLWAALLQMEGVSVIATDSEPWAETYTKVERLDVAESLAAYPETEVLMLCWPPYGEPVATLALAAFTGKRLVYIGEGNGGCTGDDTFHALLEEFWTLENDGAVIPQWPGLHDALYLYRRTELWEAQRERLAERLATERRSDG
jgi:hypothetical protein